MRIKKLNITKELHKNVMSIDFSIINEIHTCPTSGIIRYIHNKVMTQASRSLALEAGTLCHEVFAALRIKSIMNVYEPINKEVNRVFYESNSDRKEFIYDSIINYDLNTIVDTVIDSSNYYDDPNDKKRTIENIRNSCYWYASIFTERFKNKPVYITDNFVGIEQDYHLGVEIVDENDKVYKFNFMGKIDGVHVHEDGSLICVENKTAGLINNVWLTQWKMSHQITGYCLALQGLLENKIFNDVSNACVVGLQLPPAKRTPSGCVHVEFVRRQEHMFESWALWMLEGIKIIEQYGNTPEAAPMNTHSCSRYFRDCDFYPICMSEVQDRKDIIKELPENTWSPLNKEKDK